MEREESYNPDSARERKRIRMAAETIAAEDHPNRNEDQYILMPEQNAAAVFDGVGGRSNAQEASQRAAVLVREKLLALPPELTADDLAERLDQILREVDQITAQQKSGGNTTATVVLARRRDEGYDLVIGNVADSRAHLFDANGLRALTIDNQLGRQDEVSERAMRESQAAVDRAKTFEELPPDRKAYFSYGRFSIAQAIGQGNAQPSIYREAAGPDSKLLLTTDGIHDNLTAEEISAVLQQYEDPSEAAHALVEAALARSRDQTHHRHKPDDMTAAIMKLT